jgi:16S rRNA (uracil1498-N3)-methyltransferase
MHHRHPEITGSDAGHICRVLRMRAGDTVELIDGTGNGYRARIESADPKCVRLSIETSFALSSESSVRITMAQGVLKDRKMDNLVRQLTELGMARWVPFFSARSVPTPAKKGWGARTERWKKIAVEAVKQCRRGRFPTIAPAIHFSDMLADSAEYDLKLVCWEDGSKSFEIPETVPHPVKRIIAVIGPEGGFDPGEVHQAQEHGFLTIGLGPRILRAETAALAACTLLQYRFGDLERRLTRD